ncbi:hypothetical protein [Modestobacter sp. Leaf380]|uniref:hypothetical protein n=1 Tax=Modestobacter sp. Leaf380 TaxID=1736356 RepID=UPI0012FBB868|nr:hypothetical protein [Modestobacter sp. Leaf380]
MTLLKPPSDDGTLVVTYKGSAGFGGSVFGPSELFRDVAGYEGSQALTVVHFNDGTTVECRDVLMVRT